MGCDVDVDLSAPPPQEFIAGAGRVTRENFGSDADGYGTGAKLSSVVNMCMDAAGIMYVMEQNGDENPSIRMRRVSREVRARTTRACTSRSTGAA